MQIFVAVFLIFKNPNVKIFLWHNREIYNGLRKKPCSSRCVKCQGSYKFLYHQLLLRNAVNIYELLTECFLLSEHPCIY